MSVKTALAALGVFRDNLYKHQSNYSEEYFVQAERLANDCEYFLQRNRIDDLVTFLQERLRRGDAVSEFLDSWWSYIGIQGTLPCHGVLLPCWEDFEANLKEEA